MLKATAGGGGKGMQVCNDDEETRRRLGIHATRSRRRLWQRRHVHGEIRSTSRATLKFRSLRTNAERPATSLSAIAPFSAGTKSWWKKRPSPYMTDKLREKMGKAAIKAAEAVKYEGVGTVEFLVDANRDFYFMEMNTRIQVEHTITEEVVELRPHQGADQVGGRREHQRKELLSPDARHPMPNQRGRPGPQLSPPARDASRITTPRWTWSSIGYPRVCGYQIPPVLRLDDCKAHRRCADPRRSHPKMQRALGRVRHRRRQDDHPVPSAPHAPRPVPQRGFHDEIHGRGRRLNSRITSYYEKSRSMSIGFFL